MDVFQFEPQVAVAWVTAIGAIVVAFLVRRNQNTTIDVNDLVDQIAEARKDADAARTEAAALRAEVTYLTSEVKRLAALEERMADGIDERDQKIADQHERIVELQTELGVEADKRRRLESEVAELRAEVAKWRDWVHLQGYDPRVVAEQLADGTAFEE